jgi:hypothetical protein
MRGYSIGDLHPPARRAGTRPVATVYKVPLGKRDLPCSPLG